MYLLEESNRFCRRLLRDDSGVFMALTALVFLSLFLMGMAVLAVGDTVRKRMELQHAVDAAAYSAALVQADTFSRVAAINKAMAWTWVQSTRLEMDYCFDKFLEYVLKEQRKTAKWAHDKNQQGNTFKGFPFWGVIGLRPYSSGAGEHGGIIDNNEPEFEQLGGSQVPDAGNEIIPSDETIGGMFSDKTEAQLQSSEEAYRQLDLRKDALEQERDRLVAARDELRERTPPHRPDPYDILFHGFNVFYMSNEMKSNCTNASPNASPYACPDCLQWRSERNQYIKDCQQLERDYEAENKKYTDTLKSNQEEMQNQVNSELENHGGLSGLTDQLAELEGELAEAESNLGSVAETVEFYELQMQDSLDVYSDLKSVLSEIADNASFYSGMRSFFLPPTIGINSHWLLSLWGSLKRVLYRFENLDMMENLFPSLGIAGQRVRIAQMNEAIDKILFSGAESLTNIASRSGFNTARANISFDWSVMGCSYRSPNFYIAPYDSQSTRPTDDDDPEPRFLALAGYTDSPQKIFGRGWHTGDNRHGWFRRKNTKTLGRYYKQEDKGSANVAKWFFWSTRWLNIDLLIVKIIVPTYIGWGTESGDKQRRSDNRWFLNQKDIDGDGYLTGTKALKEAGGMAEWLLQDDLNVRRTWPRPHYLVKDTQLGSYSFSVIARTNNPFAFFGNKGWAKAFQIPNQIHATSISTCGYRLPQESWAAGKTYSDSSGNLHHSNLGYRTWYSDEGSMKPGKVDMEKLWNLRVTDWDALLISAHDEASVTDPFGFSKPLHRAPAGMSGNTSHGGGEGEIGTLGTQSSGALFDYVEGKKILLH